MKRIGDLLKRKKRILSSTKDFHAGEMDEKTVEKVFKEVATRKILGIQAEEIREVRIKEGKLKIKTTHPIVAGELWKKREMLIKEVNKILRNDFIREIKVL